jgi:hypothetical protein
MPTITLEATWPGDHNDFSEASMIGSSFQTTPVPPGLTEDDVLFMLDVTEDSIVFNCGGYGEPMTMKISDINHLVFF